MTITALRFVSIYSLAVKYEKGSIYIYANIIVT